MGSLPYILESTFQGAGGLSLENLLESYGCRGGRVAQLGEHLLCKQGVAGSIPATSTIFGLYGIPPPPADVSFGRSCRMKFNSQRTLYQSSLEHFAEEFLFLRGELFALRRQVEDIDSFVAFRIDQRDLDVASQPCQR